MKNIKIFFPCMLIILDLASAAVYVYHRDPRMAICWFAAAVPTSCVTF